MDTTRVAGWAGIGTFVSLLLAQFLAGGFPDVMEVEGSEITAYFGDTPKFGYALSAISFSLSLVFTCTLYTLLRGGSGEADWRVTLLLAAGIAVPIMAMMATTAESALMLTAEKLGDDGARSLLGFANMGYMWSTLAMALFLFAAWARTAASGWPGWLSYLALAGGAFAFVGVLIGATDPATGDESLFGILGFLGFIIWGLWQLLAGITLVRGRIPDLTSGGAAAGVP